MQNPTIDLFAYARQEEPEVRAHYRHQLEQKIQQKTLGSKIGIALGIVGVLAGISCAIVGGVLGITWLIPVGVAIAFIALIFSLVNFAQCQYTTATLQGSDNQNIYDL